MQGWYYGKGLIYYRPIFQFTKLAFLRARVIPRENISKYKDFYGEKPNVSVTYKNERISIKNSLPYLKYVLRLAVYWVVM